MDGEMKQSILVWKKWLSAGSLNRSGSRTQRRYEFQCKECIISMGKMSCNVCFSDIWKEKNYLYWSELIAVYLTDVFHLLRYCRCGQAWISSAWLTLPCLIGNLILRIRSSVKATGNPALLVGLPESRMTTLTTYRQWNQNGMHDSKWSDFE